MGSSSGLVTIFLLREKFHTWKVPWKLIITTADQEDACGRSLCYWVSFNYNFFELLHCYHFPPGLASMYCAFKVVYLLLLSSTRSSREKYLSDVSNDLPTDLSSLRHRTSTFVLRAPICLLLLLALLFLVPHHSHC
jgi:hypothetical protein